MPGHYIDIASGREEKSWTKCVVSNRVSRSFILSGYGGQANLYFKDLLPENPIKLGDFLEVTFRPDAATPTGNLVTGYRSCPPICPRSVTTTSNHVSLDLHLAVRFKCFIDPGGPLGGLPLYSSKFVDVVDNCRKIPLGERLGEIVYYVTAFIKREPNNERNYIWVVADVLSNQQMSRLASRGMGSGAPSQPSPSISRAILNVTTATDMDRGCPDQTVPSATDGSWGGSEAGGWSSEASVDYEAIVESPVDKRSASETDTSLLLIPEAREWLIDGGKYIDEEEEDHEELTDLNATNGSGDKRRADRYGLVPLANRLSRPPTPIGNALVPLSESPSKTADSAILAVKDSTMVPALVVSRLSDKFILSTSTFEACLFFHDIAERVSLGDSLDISTIVRQRTPPSHVVTKYRHRKPFCDSFVEKSPAGEYIRLNLYVTYKCDVNWSRGMVPCFSSDFIDAIDHRRLIGGLETGGRWKVRVSRFRDPRDRLRHIWVVTRVLKGMNNRSVNFVALSQEKPTEPNVPHHVTPRAEEAREKKEKKQADSQNVALKPPPVAVVPLDLVVAAETPITASDCDETKAETLVLLARVMRNRTVRDAIQAANRDIYEELVDRVMGVVVTK